MKSLSTNGWFYLMYVLAVCSYFTAAGFGHWPGPKFQSSGGSHSSGSSYSRSSGGSWGGGK